jgi:hypothetical protein
VLDGVAQVGLDRLLARLAHRAGDLLPGAFAPQPHNLLRQQPPFGRAERVKGLHRGTRHPQDEDLLEVLQRGHAVARAGHLQPDVAEVARTRKQVAGSVAEAVARVAVADGAVCRVEFPTALRLAARRRETARLDLRLNAVLRRDLVLGLSQPQHGQKDHGRRHRDEKDADDATPPEALRASRRSSPKLPRRVAPAFLSHVRGHTASDQQATLDRSQTAIVPRSHGPVQVRASPSRSVATGCDVYNELHRVRPPTTVIA